MMREQFAGWGMYDNEAICLDCGHHHLIAKGEQVSDQPWLDWLHKHDGHTTFLVPHSQLGKLGGLELRGNANAKIAYAASLAYSILPASLASDANLLAGVESDLLSNTANLYLDELVAGKITTGTTPTTAKQIEVHAVGALDDTPNWPDVFDGTGSAETVTSALIKAAICRTLALLATDATSNLAYPFGPIGLRQFFGDALPSAHVLFITHNTVAALHATAGNHVVKHTPVYATVT